MVVFEQCYDKYHDNLNQVIQCVSEWAENDTSTMKSTFVNTNDFRFWLYLICGALIFFMQTGFAMICAGAVRKKNMNNTMLKNLLDACGAGIAFYATGYAFAYGTKESSSTETSFLGLSNFFLSGNVDPSFFFFQFAFSATSTTIVAGTLAERCQMGAYLCFSIVLSGFVYPVVVHNIWSKNGLFSASNSNAVIETGIIDFSGAGVVHLTGGLSALFATYILGPRQGRFYDRNGSKLATPGLTRGSSVALQMLGTLILLFGWIGFNPGSALLLPTTGEKGAIAGHAAVATVLSAASATISSLILSGLMSYRKHGEFDFNVFSAMNGCLTGLVSITGSCGIVDFGSAIAIGAVGGLVYLLSERLLTFKMIDDAVGAIPVHLSGGIWGVLSVGIFSNPALLKAAFGSHQKHFGWIFNFSDVSLLGSQILEIVFIFGWVSVTMLPLFLMLQYIGWFRVNELEELVGLDTKFIDEVVMNEENSDNDEIVRLAAYRQRFLERKQKREENHGKDGQDVVLSPPETYPVYEL